MKKPVMLFTALFLAASPAFTACTPDDDPRPAADTQTQLPEPDEPQPDKPDPGLGKERLRITIGSQVFTATLADNPTGRAFAALLPATFPMEELNGNEKFHYLSAPLPAAPSGVGTIRTGDLMLFGSECLVLFYESFPTSYRYTPVARIDDTRDLSAAVGTGSVSIRFERMQ